MNIHPDRNWELMDVTARLNNLVAGTLAKYRGEYRLTPEEEREIVRKVARWWAISSISAEIKEEEYGDETDHGQVGQ